MSRALIFVNGLVGDLEAVRRLLLPYDVVIAADGGTRHALSLGLKPTVIIGDLDSILKEDRRLINKAKITTFESPRDKDETDFELALRYAMGAGHRRILVIAALGGRLDQTIGNLALLSDPALADLDVRVDDGVEEAIFTRKTVRLRGNPGDLVSLIPWWEDVSGVVTDGLRWPLQGETLFPYKTRGISNEMLADSASVTIQSGLLLVIHRRQKVEKEVR
jgi:thiamine pyrophosphokinase